MTKLILSSIFSFFFDGPGVLLFMPFLYFACDVAVWLLSGTSLSYWSSYKAGAALLNGDKRTAINILSTDKRITK